MATNSEIGSLSDDEVTEQIWQIPPLRELLSLVSRKLIATWAAKHSLPSCKPEIEAGDALPRDREPAQ